MHPVLFHLGPLVVPSYGVAVALGVLATLALAQWTARRCGLGQAVGPRHAWNMIVLAVFSAIFIERLLLIVMNLSDLRHHPQWLLAIAMVHHPLLAGVGMVGAVAAILIYARWAQLPIATVGDCLAAPLCLGLAAEQVGALLAGSDYGREYGRASAWAVIYTNALAARWSGTPLGVPLYPVQAYAAAGALLLSLLLILALLLPRRAGDLSGAALIGLGVLLFSTELFRDWEGRGVLLGGLTDIPQLVALGLVLLGGVTLADWRPRSGAASAA